MNLEDPTALAADLGAPEAWLVVLDFDGVLAPIVERPEDAAPAPGMTEAIGALAQRTTLAVVSGRPIAELDQRLGRLPIIYAGGHGAEVRTADGHESAFVDPDTVAGPLDQLQRRLQDLLEHEPGWQIERKAASLAVHYRRAAPDRRDALLGQVHAAFEARRGDGPGFEVLDGKAVVELRPSGIDKGRALAWIADQVPTRRPVVLGDDVTDEDAFREAAQRDGFGILVADEPRATVARRRLRDPHDVATFLRAFGTAPGSDAPS